MDTQKNTWGGPLILGVSLILSSVIGAGTFYKVRALDNTLEVTGSAKQQVSSDLVKWSSSFTRTVTIDDLKGGYSQMATDLASVKSFLAKNGLSEKDYDVSAVIMNEDYVDPNSGRPRQYTLRQTIQLQSSDVDGITKLAKNTTALINSGVIFSTDGLEYYYSKLPDLRVSLLGEAVTDAKARAAAIAQSGGQQVGSLKSAGVGSVQVLQVNSTDVSDYGTYDTSAIQKEVMVTVRATFNIQ